MSTSYSHNRPYPNSSDPYHTHSNILGSYASSGRLAKMTREVDFTPLSMDKNFRPQVSNLYQYYTHIPGLIQGKEAYFSLDTAYGRR